MLGDEVPDPIPDRFRDASRPFGPLPGFDHGPGLEGRLRRFLPVKDSVPSVHAAGEVPKVQTRGVPCGPDDRPVRDRLGGRFFHARKDGLIGLRLGGRRRLGSGDFSSFRFLDQFRFDVLRFVRRDQGDR